MSKEAVAYLQALSRRLHRDASLRIDDAIVGELGAYLGDMNADVRYCAASVVKADAINGGTAAGELLDQLRERFDDEIRPSWGEKYPRNPFTVAREAVLAVAYFFTLQSRRSEFAQLLERDESTARRAFNGLLIAKTPEELEVVLPDLDLWCAHGDPSVRRAAVAARVHLYWLQERWDDIAVLLESNDEQTRLSVISMLDDIVERGDDVTACLTAAFRRLISAESKRERQAAARLAVTVRVQKRGANRSFVVDGVDVMKLPEVRAELRELGKFIRDGGD